VELNMTHCCLHPDNPRLSLKQQKESFNQQTDIHQPTKLAALALKLVQHRSPDHDSSSSSGGGGVELRTW
jgi:hypothetical protein